MLTCKNTGEDKGNGRRKPRASAEPCAAALIGCVSLTRRFSGFHHRRHQQERVT